MDLLGIPKFIRSFRKDNSPDLHGGGRRLHVSAHGFPVDIFWPIGVWYFKATDTSVKRVAKVDGPFYDGALELVADDGRCDMSGGEWANCPVRTDAYTGR